MEEEKERSEEEEEDHEALVGRRSHDRVNPMPTTDLRPQTCRSAHTAGHHTTRSIEKGRYRGTSFSPVRMRVIPCTRRVSGTQAAGSPALARPIRNVLLAVPRHTRNRYFVRYLRTVGLGAQ